MTRNLWICGLGMMLAGILGLYGHALAAPAGVVAVGDHDAASLFGGAATSCSRYYATTGCGGNAKPKMGMIPGTKCPKVPGVYWLPIFGNLRYKQSVVVTCYECCYACGSVRIPLDACAPTGSGSGRPTPETGGLP